MLTLVCALSARSEVDLQLALNLPRKLERLKLSRALAFDDAALACLAEQALQRFCAGSEAHTLTALDVGSPHITDAALPSLLALTRAGLSSLTLWHSRLSRSAVQRLIEVTDLALDTSMASSDGTYLLHRVGKGPFTGAPPAVCV